MSEPLMSIFLIECGPDACKANHDVYRWRLRAVESRPRRLWRGHDFRRIPARAQRRLSPDNKQPHGVDGGNPGLAVLEGTLRCRRVQRLAICGQRDYQGLG